MELLAPPCPPTDGHALRILGLIQTLDDRGRVGHALDAPGRVGHAKAVGFVPKSVAVLRTSEPNWDLVRGIGSREEIVGRIVHGTDRQSGRVFSAGLPIGSM